MWRVELVKDAPLSVVAGVYGGAYFPRLFRYKTDAKDLKRAVMRLGGEARVVRETRSSLTPQKAPTKMRRQLTPSQ